MNGDNDYDDIVNTALAPSLNRAVRGADKLKGVRPELVEHWNKLDQEFKKAGIVPEIKSGYRTAEQQNALYRNPATRARTKGNDGYTKISPHQRGDALDVSFAANQRALGRRILAQYAQSNGLHIPSDEPWHITLTSQKPQADPYADVVDAAVTKETPQAQDDPYDDVVQAALGQQPKTPQVTSTVREEDSQQEIPSGAQPQTPVAVQPLAFQPSGPTKAPTINPVKALYEASEADAVQPRGLRKLQSREYQAPLSREVGERIKLSFPHGAPTEDDVVQSYLSSLGPEYVQLGEKYKAETGHNILILGGSVKQEDDGSFSIRPTRGAVDFINAYAKGGLNAALPLAEQQRREFIKAQEDARLKAQPAIERARRAVEIEKNSPTERGLFTAGAGPVQAAGTILGPLGSDVRRGAEEMKAVGEQAEIEKPLKSLSTGEQVEYGAGALIPTAASLLGTRGLGAAQLPALGALEGQTPQERLGGAVQGAVMHGLMGPISEQLGESLSSGAKKAVAGPTLAAVPAGQAIAGGEPVASALIQNAPFAVMPLLGKGTSPERPTELGIEKAIAGVPGEVTANIDQRLSERESKVQPTFLRDDQGNPVARVLNPTEVAEGAKPKVRAIHQSDIQARDESGKFTQASPQPNQPLSEPPVSTETSVSGAVPKDAASMPERQQFREVLDAKLLEQGITDPQARQQVVDEVSKNEEYYQAYLASKSGQIATESAGVSVPAPESLLRNATKSTGSDPHPFATITKPEWTQKILNEAGEGARQMRLSEIAAAGLAKDDPFGAALYFKTKSGDIVKISRASTSDKPPTVGTSRDGLVIEQIAAQPQSIGGVSVPQLPAPSLRLNQEMLTRIRKHTAYGGSEGTVGELLKDKGEAKQFRAIASVPIIVDPSLPSGMPARTVKLTPRQMEADQASSAIQIHVRPDATEEHFYHEMIHADRAAKGRSIEPSPQWPHPEEHRAIVGGAYFARKGGKQGNLLDATVFPQPETKPVEKVTRETPDAESTASASSAPLSRLGQGESISPSTTSARKDQLAADRAELDLPELPAPERKGWRQSLINAKEKGLDQKAERLADRVLRNPRALDDEQTAGMTLRLQQLKNEHSQLLKEVGDGDFSPEKRADLQAVEDSFDKISAAVKASGTEKGRALASQKLTINQDYDLISMLNRYKAKTGKEPSPEIRKEIEGYQNRIAELEKQAADREVQPTVQKIQREARRERRQVTKKVLDEEAAAIKQNIAAEFARLKAQAAQNTNLSQQGLGLLDPDGVITRNALKYVRNRVEAGVTDTAQLIDDVHGVLSEFVEGVTKRQVAEMISGYGRPAQQTRSELQKQLDTLRSQMRAELKQADVESGIMTARRQGPPNTKQAIERRYQKQIQELERRIRDEDFGPRPKRGPTVLDAQTRQLQVQVERAKQDYDRALRKWRDTQRSKPEKIADLLVNWGRAAKLSYVLTLGKLSGAATGRMGMSPLENLIGEIPHRLSPELSRRATTEGGGFDRAAEVAALWKSGRFRQVLDQLTKGGSDLDVLFGPQGKMADKEIHGRGVLGVPGRAHGMLKEYPRQAEFDRQRVKVLKAYEREGRDITSPNVQLAANMEAFNSAERARFQQRNFISDTFNDAMRSLEKKGIAGKAASKAGRFVFPITRVPVNVVGETLNYTFGLPRAVIETAIRGGVKNLTPEQANNIMRAYKKGGVGLAVMAYAFTHPKQFGGYYQPQDKRKEGEPKPGEMMFFGHRIPKWATHIPILEAAQLAATSRRVYDKLTEKGESKLSAVGGGAKAAGLGLAAQIPFYETPGRIREGLTTDVGRLAGQQVKGMIPGFIQEAARVMDKNEAGETVSRKRAGFIEEIQEGIPGLRRRLPESETERANFKDRLSEGMRKGKRADLDKLVESGKITESERQSLERESEMTPRQSAFSRAFPDQSLARYERMDENQRMEVRELMEKKAWSLLNSDKLTEAQKEAFQKRIDALGIEPRNPNQRTNSFIPSFRTRFQQGARP